LGGKLEIELKGELRIQDRPSLLAFTKYKAYAELSGVIVTGISLECVTKADRHSIYVEPEIKFEGLSV